MVSAQRAASTKILELVPSEAFLSTAELMVSAALLLFQAGDYEAIRAAWPGRWNCSKAGPTLIACRSRSAFRRCKCR
jgi:hypothetical protein